HPDAGGPRRTPAVHSAHLHHHVPPLLSFLLTIPRPPRSPLFPYTTLFRSAQRGGHSASSAEQRGGPAFDNSASPRPRPSGIALADRKSTRLNSSHVAISYAVFCLKKKNETTERRIRVERGGQFRHLLVSVR